MICSVSANSPPRFVIEEGNEIVVNLREGPSTPVGSVITKLQASDPDGDDLVFGSQGEDAKALLHIEKTGPNTATVSLKTLLDREQRGEYTLVLTVTDGKLGDDTYVTQSLLLLVEDVNDNEPVFLPYDSSILVEENSAPRVLASLRAMDSDEGPYGQVVYALSGDQGDERVFSVNTVGSKAVLKLTGTLDYETKNIYQLKYLYACGVLQGNVTRIPEDIPVNAGVLQVKAVDGDRGVDNRIRYSLLDGGDGFFGLDADSGVLYVAQPLDRERDGATGEAFFIRIRGVNGTFRLEVEGAGGVFDVTPHEGINLASFLVRVRDPALLDYERLQVVNFTLVARETVPDRPKSSSCLVSVYIRDTNDNVPIFERDMYEAEEVSSVVSPAPSSTTEVTVVLTDVNDQTPQFRASHYVAEVSESSQFNMPVNFIGDAIPEVYDNDQVSRLSLDAVTGALRLKEAAVLDREEVSDFFVTVEVRDDNGHGNRNTVGVHVIIVDVNDNAPVFSERGYEAKIDENSPDFSVPLVVVARDADANGTVNHEVRYSLVGGDPQQNFTLDAVRGELRPSGPLDYERLKPEGSLRFFNLTVKATDLGTPPLSSLCQVVVYVGDVNDHSPEFGEDAYYMAVHEDTPGGTTVIHVHAHDGDGSALYSKVVYRLQHGAEDKFVIDAETGAILVARGAVLDPDRTQPRTTEYLLEVVALDGGIGEAQRQTVTFVNISIVDVNNKPPVFIDPGTVRVRESVTPGNFIAKVAAFDVDDDAELRYALDTAGSEARNEEGAVVKPSEYNYAEAFDIGETDGVIRLVRALDREKVETIRLLVLCEDLNTQQGSRSTSTTLTIIVEDTNDNDPQFRRPLYGRSVAENAKVGMTILTVVADDVDKNRTIIYSLEGGQNVTGLVHLDPETGEVVVKSRIDREAFQWLNFSVVAADSGVPQRTQHVDVFLQIVDENDNVPYFVNPPSRVVVSEDAPPGTVILELLAADADEGDYSRITYLLDPKSSQGMFKMDPDNGQLSVAQPLDREKIKQYNLIAEAWDNYKYGGAAGDSRKVFTHIIVDIADINDEVPVFDPRSGCSTVTEFHAAGDAVAVVRASDADDPEGGNGKIRFSITGGNDKGLFDIETIDMNSARIITRAPLVGLYGNYTIMVAATDLGDPPNEMLQPVDVCVTDYNDHPPRFVSPNSNLTIRVPENATVGSLVIQVRAVDDDVGANGAVRYRLLKDSSAVHRTFGVDQMTGAITLLRPLDREMQKLYELRIEAHDQGLPTPLKGDLDLTIYVRNVNDNKPQFPQDFVVVNFTENTSPGSDSLLLPDTVDVDDLDLDELDNSVCYYIVGGDSLKSFSLDKLTHVLQAVKPLDREELEQHVLIVQASEDCVKEPPQVPEFDATDDTLLKVIVNVNDVNDNSPKFLKKVFTGGISTESAFGFEVLELMAEDLDYGSNAALRFQMIGTVQATVSEGLDHLRQQPFVVDPKTGIVKLNFDPQRGMKGYFDFKVGVTDGSEWQDEARVFVYLLREDQRVRFLLRLAPDEIRSRIEYLRDYLSNVTGAIVNVDEYRVHETQDGDVDQTKTDLYLHFVNPEDNSVLEVPQVLSTIDKNVHRLDHLFKELNVLDTSQAHLVGVAGVGLSSDDNLLMVWLVGVVAFLALLLVVTLSLCVAQRAHYARQLKAATATAFGSNESVLNRNPTVPNTNLHSVEGSNPIWMSGGFDNEWYKEEESLRYQAFTLITTTRTVATYITPSRSSPTRSWRRSLRPQNFDFFSSQVVDPHHYDTYRSNLHHTFKKLTNPLIEKKLETTEL
ncbi:cadherin-23 [Hyalella azteca]|uniref:Cadherin-23 n=1 Tax=Hyalella azteca TaxID=294128 RepID=A0A979FRW9_HYAAZ|nr:cadherin-23 [Hyalella azteca]